MRITKLNNQREDTLILNQILSTVLKSNVWRSVWRICMRILGLRGLKIKSWLTKRKHNFLMRKKIDHSLQPVFTSQKVGDLKMREPKQPLINQQCMVYNY